MQEKKTSVNFSYVKGVNQKLILRTIYDKATTSRAELSKQLSLSKPTISDNLSSFLNIGIIEELGEGAVSEKGGRKPLLLKFNKKHKYIIAVDLNYSNPVFVLGNLKNEIISQFDIQISMNASLDSYYTVIENGINILLSSSGFDRKDLLCIAIASPGVFDEKGNLLSLNPSYGGVLWCTIDFRDLLQKKYNVNVIIKNDIKAATMGEWAYGAGIGANNLLYISCGVGLGAGIVLNSQLYEGILFNAGEIYNYLDASMLERGETLEDTLCMKYLIQNTVEDIKAGKETCLKNCANNINFKSIVEAYNEKDPYILSKVKEVCIILCTLIFNFSNFLALDKVIFGGEYTVFGETLLEEYKKKFQPRSNFVPEIRLAALNKNSGIHGLLYIAREAYFDFICNHNGV